MYLKKFRPLDVLLFVGCLTVTGCSKPSVEKVMIGQWQMSKAETEKTNPFVAAMPGGSWYEFKDDGTYAEGLMGGTFKGTWKQVKKEGNNLTLEMSKQGDKEPQTVEIAMIDKDHITINYPKGLGVIHLKRGSVDTTVSAKDTGKPAESTISPRVSIDTGGEYIRGISVSGDGKLVAVRGQEGPNKYYGQVWTFRKRQRYATSPMTSTQKLLCRQTEKSSLTFMAMEIRSW